MAERRLAPKPPLLRAQITLGRPLLRPRAVLGQRTRLGRGARPRWALTRGTPVRTSFSEAELGLQSFLPPLEPEGPPPWAPRGPRRALRRAPASPRWRSAVAGGREEATATATPTGPAPTWLHAEPAAQPDPPPRPSWRRTQPERRSRGATGRQQAGSARPSPSPPAATGRPRRVTPPEPQREPTPPEGGAEAAASPRRTNRSTSGRLSPEARKLRDAHEAAFAAIPGTSKKEQRLQREQVERLLTTAAGRALLEEELKVRERSPDAPLDRNERKRRLRVLGEVDSAADEDGGDAQDAEDEGEDEEERAEREAVERRRAAARAGYVRKGLAPATAEPHRLRARGRRSTAVAPSRGLPHRRLWSAAKAFGATAAAWLQAPPPPPDEVPTRGPSWRPATPSRATAPGRDTEDSPTPSGGHGRGRAPAEARRPTSLAAHRRARDRRDVDDRTPPGSAPRRGAPTTALGAHRLRAPGPHLAARPSEAAPVFLAAERTETDSRGGSERPRGVTIGAHRERAARAEPTQPRSARDGYVRKGAPPSTLAQRRSPSRRSTAVAPHRASALHREARATRRSAARAVQRWLGRGRPDPSRPPSQRARPAEDTALTMPEPSRPWLAASPAGRDEDATRGPGGVEVATHRLRAPGPTIAARAADASPVFLGAHRDGSGAWTPAQPARTGRTIDDVPPGAPAPTPRTARGGYVRKGAPPASLARLRAPTRRSTAVAPTAAPLHRRATSAIGAAARPWRSERRGGQPAGGDLPGSSQAGATATWSVAKPSAERDSGRGAQLGGHRLVAPATTRWQAAKASGGQTWLHATATAGGPAAATSASTAGGPAAATSALTTGAARQAGRTGVEGTHRSIRAGTHRVGVRPHAPPRWQSARPGQPRAVHGNTTLEHLVAPSPAAPAGAPTRDLRARSGGVRQRARADARAREIEQEGHRARAEREATEVQQRKKAKFGWQAPAALVAAHRGATPDRAAPADEDTTGRQALARAARRTRPALPADDDALLGLLRELADRTPEALELLDRVHDELVELTRIEGLRDR